MKLTKIFLKDVYQFQDMEIDLTYPEGHPKKGEPLDRVCIIGQSGTGKTKLLRLIHDVVLTSAPLPFKTKKYRPLTGSMYVEIKHENIYMGTNPVSPNATYLSYYDNFKNPVETDDEKLFEKYKNPSYGPLLVFYPHLIKNSESNGTRIVEIAGTPGKFEINDNDNVPLKLDSNEKHWYYDFSEINIELMWAYILKDVRDYRRNKLALDTEFADKVRADPSKFEEEKKRLEQWDMENPNPLELLANNIDKILKHFYLKIDTGLKGVIGNIAQSHIPAKHSISNQEFDFFQLSTGTQRIINTGIPLYQLKPQDAIIIFDEVENSLYPDIQKIIIDYYTGLAPSCQFFFATHSPIIASNFEPWEIVELKFNEEGKVYREEYFKGERHVDNYFIHPKLLRWDEILTDVFDLKEEGNEERNKKLQELANLMGQIKALQKKKASDAEIDPKIDEYKKLAGLLNWNISA